MGSHGNGANQLSHGDLLISRELIESTLELIADRLVFLLLLDLGFSVISALLGALKIHLQHRQTSGGLIIFSVRILSDHLRFLE